MLEINLGELAEDFSVPHDGVWPDVFLAGQDNLQSNTTFKHEVGAVARRSSAADKHDLGANEALTCGSIGLLLKRSQHGLSVDDGGGFSLKVNITWRLTRGRARDRPEECSAKSDGV
jgi:hypothetical protein